LPAAPTACKYLKRCDNEKQSAKEFEAAATFSNPHASLTPTYKWRFKIVYQHPRLSKRNPVPWASAILKRPVLALFLITNNRLKLGRSYGVLKKFESRTTVYK
jgi:hypothetical protein